MSNTYDTAGRPTKYKPEYVNIVESLAKMGATMRDIAEAFNVTLSTIYVWAKNHPEFSESLVAGKELRDEYVINSLYHRAIGYTHPDTDIRVVGGDLVETPIVKHYPPDTRAAEFILTNRGPKEWGHRQQVDHTSSDRSMTPTPLDPETIRAISKALDEEC